MELQEQTLKPTDITAQLEITDSASGECCGNDLVGKARTRSTGSAADDPCQQEPINNAYCYLRSVRILCNRLKCMLNNCSWMLNLIVHYAENSTAALRNVPDVCVRWMHKGLLKSMPQVNAPCRLYPCDTCLLCHFAHTFSWISFLCGVHAPVFDHTVQLTLTHWQRWWYFEALLGWDKIGDKPDGRIFGSGGIHAYMQWYMYRSMYVCICVYVKLCMHMCLCVLFFDC